MIKERDNAVQYIAKPNQKFSLLVEDKKSKAKKTKRAYKKN